jgi:uncharacterized oligopeptide transporter (OPT) family protein
MSAPSVQDIPVEGARKRFLPRIGSTGYYILLGAVAILILGPLGGITSSYMCFSLGFFVGGQVLAGILGSVVTYGYGAEGKHGANYMQTMAASVAGMSAMAVLLQAMVWLGVPEPPAWQLVLFFGCIGMFGVGVGMLYTPILVDRMQLSFPSGLAVANILRALTDKRLLRRSVAQLGGGTALGIGGAVLAEKVKFIGALDLSPANIGAGMVIGARIAIPALVLGTVGELIVPYLREIHWLGEKDPFRKVGFLIALGMILGAAIVDLTLIGVKAVRRIRERVAQPAAVQEDWKRTNTVRLVLWVLFWGAAVVVVASVVLQQPVEFVLLAVGLVFVFLMVNGISMGISDNNPISSAFVMAVFLMAALGLKSPAVGLMCASILLVATSVGVDMQQDRSTGWRLGTNRKIQFRFQVIGVIMGAIMAVVLAKVFMSAYPVLQVDTFTNPNVEGASHWQSAMTYKFVGALKGLTNPEPHVMIALGIGVGIGFLTEVLRKLSQAWKSYQRFRNESRVGYATGFVLDAVILPSPYATAFGGFVSFFTNVWLAIGGVLGSLIQVVQNRLGKGKNGGDIPEDMSTHSLIGGGLIAGDSLAALGFGIYGLLSTVM